MRERKRERKREREKERKIERDVYHLIGKSHTPLFAWIRPLWAKFEF